MNLQYLGDALDHWKGAILRQLQSSRCLADLAVDAMASDASEWNATDKQLFAGLLNIRAPQIIEHAKSLVAEHRIFR